MSGSRPLPLAAGSSAWTAVGPLAVNSAQFGLVTGRVSSLALDPTDATGNKLFVGTTGGGVWKSQNAAAAAGVQFVPLTDEPGALQGVQQAGISVGAISVQPGGTGVVLAGLGDPNDALDSYYGAGLLRSADNGATWTLIQHTMDQEGGQDTREYWFVGEGFAGFAWSTTNVQLVVAAVSQAYEGTLVNAGKSALSYSGLYYSTDGGATWHLARIEDPSGPDLQGPGDTFAAPDGNAATAVVWNPVRQVFVAAVRFHGYYQSLDGVTWTRMAAQPGTGLAWTGTGGANCPSQAGNVGVVGCPIFRGALAVNPQTGDTFAWTVDANNQDQGIWQDQCGLSGNVCTSPSISFGLQLDTSALDQPGFGGDALIANGDYNLTLAAVPGGLGTGQDTLLFAGANDLWKCSLANSCQWRNTTNTETCQSAKVGEYQHAVAWDAGNPQVMYVGNDSGLWRSGDQVGETGSVCAATDAGHFTNLNGSLGSLAEVESLAQSGSTAASMLTGLGANGFAGIVNAPAAPGTWNQLLGGEGGSAAIDQLSNLNSWYANNGAGVSIFHCTSSTACTAGGFGATPVVGEAQVSNDGFSMGYPAEFLVDAADSTQLLIGTCRVWRGPANGAGWSAANAISPILDGTSGSVCNGNALIRSMAVLPLAGGGEVIYVGMAGAQDGGGIVAGHVFSATISSAGVVGNWTDLTFSPVLNVQLALNPFGRDLSSIYVDPHDATGGTVYVTVAGFTSAGEPTQQIYWSTDGGQHWTSIKSNLFNSPVSAVVVDPQDANTVYVGSDAGVFVTRSVSTCASSPCWTAYGTGLPLSPVTQLVATPTHAASAVLTAGTYGRGVWQIPLVTAGANLTSATVTPASLSFAGRTVGTASAALTVTVKTTGTAELALTGILFTGVAAGDYAETDTCVGVSVAKNATCLVKVVFTPAAAGGRAATLVMNGNVAGGELLVSLAGTGVSTGAVTLQPATLSFGTQQVGAAAATQVVNVQNSGGTAVSITSLAVTAPFSKAASTCGSTLAAGAACAVTVGFTPTQAGAVAGTLTLVDSAGTQTATLSGTGVAGPTDTLSATALAFPNTVVGQNSALVVQITNTGGLPLTTIGTSISVGAGSVAGDFKAVSNCGGTLVAGGSCGITVTFAPTVVKTETGTLVISDALRSQNVSLSGRGLAPPVITLAPKSVNFGSQQLNLPTAAKLVTIQNSGGSPMGTPSFSVTGPGAASWQVGANTCGTSVGPGGNCTVALVFQPLAVGALTATLTVGTSTIGVASSTVALQGTGLSPPALKVAPAVINMGSVGVSRSSALFTVQVTNIGQIGMTGLTFAVSGTYADDFDLSAPTDIAACTPVGKAGTLAAGASCNMQVTFSPSIFGVETATLTVTGANAVPTTATVSMTGTGVSLIQLQANPTQLQFPTTVVGLTSATKTVSLSNLGRQNANGLALAVAGPYALVPGSTTCQPTFTALSSCTVGVSFTPTANGEQPGTLTATVTNLGVPALVVGLDGTGQAVGGIAPTPTQMTFGSVVVKTVSAAQTLTVTNSGEAALAGLGIGGSGDFSITANQCGTTLAAGASCTVGVLFTPATTGKRTGTLTISTTSTGVAPSVVSLVGNGIPAGALSSAPVVVSFGTVTVGQSSPPQTVVLTNAGATALTGLQYLLSGDYSLPQNGCGAQLASGAQCSFTVSFTPAVPGTRIGAVTVQSAVAGFVPLVVGLTGTGLPAAQLIVTPPALGFGSVAVGANSVALQLTLTNPGTGTLAGLFFATASPFSVGSGSCGASVIAGGTCGVPVTFAPRLGGDQSGTVTVSSTSLGVPAVRVAVVGTGVLPAALSVTPASVEFGGVTVGMTAAAQAVTLTNTGGFSLTGLVVTSGGDFSLTGNTCTATLAAGASCTVTVTFTPSVAGGRQAFLTASSTTKGVASVSTSLTGEGLTPAVLGMTPAQLDFAAILVGQVSATQTVTVTNLGQSGIADLTLGVTAGFRVDAAKTTCTATLAAGGSCVVGVAFTPGLGGVITGSVTASSAVAFKSGTAPATAALSGTGALPPGIVSVPGALVQFQTTGVGQAAESVTVTVTNTGTLTALTGLTAAVDSNGIANGFGLGTNNCGSTTAPGTLAAAASCTMNVTFKPSRVGQLSGSLLLSSTNGGNPISLSLGGIGADFSFTGVGSSTVTVVRGQTAYFTLAVTPQGGVGSGVINFACSGVPSNSFCIFNPPTLGPLKSTGNVVMGISTTAPKVTKAVRKSLVLDGEQGAGGTLLLVCGVVALPLGWWRRRLYRQAGKIVGCLWLLLILIGGICGVTSCAGAGGSSGQLQLGGGTPPGSYTIAVTASSTGVTHSFTVKLVVN